MIFDYIQGLHFSRLATDGIFLIKDSKGQAADRLLCTYKFRHAFEQRRLYRVLREYMQRTDIQNYVLCPIIDVEFLSKIDIRSNFQDNYENEYPYFFISRQERNTLFAALNNLQRVSPQFNKSNTAETVFETHRQTLECLKTPSGISKLYQTISNYSNLYRVAYKNDWMLQLIARNVFLQLQREIVTHEREHNLKEQESIS